MKNYKYQNTNNSQNSNINKILSVGNWNLGLSAYLIFGAFAGVISKH